MAGRSTLARYTVLLEAQSARFERAIQQAERRTQRFDRTVTRAVNNIKVAFAALGVGLSIRGISQAIGRSLDYADSLDKLNKRLGVSVEALSELDFAAQRSGINFQTLTLGLQRLQRRVAEAAVGTGEARGALKELGIEATKLRRLELDKQFEVVAEALSQVTLDADKTRLAMKLFDSEGVALLQTMKNGAAGIQELRNRARELGITLDTATADKMAKAKDAINDLQFSFNALATNLTGTVAPAMARFITDLNTIIFGTELAKVDKQIADLQARLRLLASTPGFDNPQLVKVLQDQILDLSRQRDALTASAEAAETLDAQFKKLSTTSAKLAFEETSKELARFTRNQDAAAEAARKFRAAYQVERRLQAARESIAKTSDELDDFIEKQERITRAQREFQTLGALNKNAERYELATAAIAKTSDELDAFIDKQNTAAETAKARARELGFTFQSAFEDAIVEGEKLRTVLQGLAKDILRILIRRSITEPLAGAISGIFGRAHGGPVASGSPYIVGERGPELFVPSASGNIVSNDKIARASPSITFVTNIEAGVDATRLLPLLEQNNRKLKGEFLNELNRGQYS